MVWVRCAGKERVFGICFDVCIFGLGHACQQGVGRSIEKTEK